MNPARAIVWVFVLSHSLVVSVGGADRLAADVVDLAAWKLTLPIDTPRPGRPDEIEQPLLAAFVDPEFFFVRAGGEGVAFRAPCNGIPTKGSRYARCELRQMEPSGRREAAWSTTDEPAHELVLRAAFTRVPKKKPHAVCAQIHDAERDVLMVRLEGSKLFVERKPDADVMLNAHYKLGSPFELLVRAGEGRVQLWYDGALKLDWPVERRGCYFKAGCYVQSKLEKDDASEYAEVVVERLAVR
jgi:hypothetical protein